MVLGEWKLMQGLKAGFTYSGFSAVRAKAVTYQSCPDAGKKQILRVAYPNSVGAPSGSAQDDTKFCETGIARLKSGPDTGLRYLSLMDFSKVS